MNRYNAIDNRYRLLQEKWTVSFFIFLKINK